MLTVTSTTTEKVPIYSNPKNDAGPAPIKTSPTVTVASGLGTWQTATADEIAADTNPGLIGFAVSEDVAGSTDYSVSNGSLIDTIDDSYELPAPVPTDLGLSSGTPIAK